MRKCGISNWPSGKNENIGNQMTSKQWELQKTATQATTSHHLSVTLALNNEQRSWWPQKQNFKTCFEECCVSWIGRFNDQGSRINWEHARLVSRLWPLFFMTEVLDCKPFLRLEPIVFWWQRCWSKCKEFKCPATGDTMILFSGFAAVLESFSNIDSHKPPFCMAF